MSTILDFKHRQSAHCETGAAANLFQYHGIEMSEPMIFGLASGLAYAYLPFVKINGLPLIAYRTPPRMILKMLSWRIKGLNIAFKTFKNKAEGEHFLDEKLNAGQVVGLQTSVYFLPYFPKEMRFHFNAHNLLVFARSITEGVKNYHISDPVFEHTEKVAAQYLSQARFAKGALAPNGRIYYFKSVPDSVDFENLIPKAIRFTGKMNAGRFIPIAGVSGMRKVANKIEHLEKKSLSYQQLFLGHIVRMQEEIGTGGAGFRYMYGAFLQESAVLINRPELESWAQEFVVIGDKWREFALLCARMNKSRGNHTLKEIADSLRNIANEELMIYQKMAKFK